MQKVNSFASTSEGPLQELTSLQEGYSSCTFTQGAWSACRIMLLNDMLVLSCQMTP